MANNVQELLEMLDGMIREARSVPLSGDKCMLERERVLDVLDSIKAQLPSELAEAKRLVDARAEFIANAKRDAEAVKHAAEERAKQLVNEQEICRIAQAKSRDMMDKAQRKSAEIMKMTNSYIDKMLGQTEETIARALDETREVRNGIRQAVTGAPAPETQEEAEAIADVWNE
ncbi:MAG: hypothetical protein MJ075_00580 [Oscillospiraceae bacterium]|nr:hypothetical protein [Oscillospiraceae bacterium]